MARLPDGALMQRAAAALAVQVASLLRRHRGGVAGRRVVLLVGSGNNGGDALWAGSRLARRGARVDAVLVAERVHAEGLAALAAAGGRARDVRAPGEALERADVVVDGLLGIGARGGLRDAGADVATRVPAGVPVVAVDLPSGVDPDTGETPGPFLRADATVTFGTGKPCLLLPPGDRAAGDVTVVDIGLDDDELGPACVERLEARDVARLWPVPGAGDDKYSRGVLGVVAGGSAYPGAAVLCTGAAVRAGAGMVRYVGPAATSDIVRSRWPEVVAGEGRVQAWAVGSGVDPDEPEQGAAVASALASGLPCVVDAGALAVLPPRVEGPTLLTPHAGELSRLLTARGRSASRRDVEERPLIHARAAAELTGATVLLKGATTLVVPPEGPARSQADAPYWLATAGAGDVLTGVAGVLLAGGLSPLDAGSVAAAVHGAAASAASRGGPLHAEAVLHAVQGTVARLLRAAAPGLRH